MNYMSEIAKMLGVELGERFKLSDSNYDYYDDYYFTDDGVQIDKDGFDVSQTLLADIISGKYTIKRKPWKPNEDDSFWFVDADEVVCRYCHFNNQDADYVNYYKLGNCYRTKEEAEANRDKWIAFYKSDEVLAI